jgi:hypothetical protein
MGPIHNFAAYAKLTAPTPHPDSERDPRLAPSAIELKVEAEFEAHPDLRALMRELDEWYCD